MLPSDANPIVGIDFGTSGSRVAVYHRGKPIVIETGEGAGTLPADVLITPGGDVVVGAAARRAGPHDGAVVVHAAKRLLGRTWDDPAIADLKRELGPNLIRGEEGMPAITVGEIIYSAADVCTFIFKEIRTIASAALRTDVTRAVLAVPADYGLLQRRSLRTLAESVGLEIVRIVTEPTAAAMSRASFGANRKVAIYDLGGGTFDISILEVGDGVLEVLAADCDPFLGGEDIDIRLCTYILERAGLGAEELDNPSMFALRKAVEALKRELSERDTAKLRQIGLKRTDGRKVDVEVTVTRETLQNISQDLVDRTLAICARAVSAVGTGGITRTSITPAQIDDVVLVGGTTHLPFIEDCVARFFGQEPDVGPRREDAVALGCAVFAGILDGKVKDGLLLDVLPRACGVRINGDEPIIMLERNSFVPGKTRHVVTTASGGSGELKITVFEGDDPESEVVLGEVSHSPIRDQQGRAVLDILLDADANSELSLRVTDSLGGHTEAKIFAASVSGVSASAFIPPATKVMLAHPSRSERRYRFLAVGTEWNSGAGGLSTLNRELCVALSAAGHDVYCHVLTATAHEQKTAEAAGVKLVEAPRGTGTPQEASLARKPNVPPEWRPDIVIGHGRVTGPAAAIIVDDHFPDAARMHFIHMAPDEIEWFKLDRTDDAGQRADERTKIERNLAASAQFVAAIGPRLHNRFLTELADTSISPIRVDPGFDNSDVTPLQAPGGAPHRILLAGRTEDVEIKGLDIAAKALGELSARWTGTPFELTVRGAPSEESAKLRARLLKLSGIPGMNLVVRPFSSSLEDLAGDYRRSSLVIMPSRREGFGLVGLEAICAGVPVLVSAQSGLGEILTELLPPEGAARTVVAVTNDLRADSTAWARAIERVLLDRDTAFIHASALRAKLAREVTWAHSVRALMTAIEMRAVVG